MITVLTVVTLVLVLAIVLAVAYHLVGIYLALKRGGDHLEALVADLAAVRDDTAPLNGKVDTINQGLRALLQPLSATNGNLAAIVALVRQG